MLLRLGVWGVLVRVEGMDEVLDDVVCWLLVDVFMVGFFGCLYGFFWLLVKCWVGVVEDWLGCMRYG